ncbi:MAG: hypothetical protein ACOCQX_02435 [Candidatus Nanoarchaeia archaeon]
MGQLILYPYKDAKSAQRALEGIILKLREEYYPEIHSEILHAPKQNSSSPFRVLKTYKSQERYIINSYLMNLKYFYDYYKKDASKMLNFIVGCHLSRIVREEEEKYPPLSKELIEQYAFMDAASRRIIAPKLLNYYGFVQPFS